jgi:hypothetical protein
MRTAARTQLSSSDARDAILSRHDDLRGLVLETIHRAEDATTQSGPDLESLRAHAKELYEAFQTHVDFEERILATALRDVIGLGSLMQAEMKEGHERQRATLASAMSALEPEGLSGERLVESVRSVADALLLDLSTEDQCLLHADLDAIATDSEGG